MKKLLLTFIALGFFFCSDPNVGSHSDYITRDNASLKIDSIKSSAKNLDSVKIQILDLISDVSQGYSHYISRLKKTNPIVSQYAVDSARFIGLADSLFLYFKTNKVTYDLIILQIDSLEKESKSKNVPVSSLIDSKYKKLADFNKITNQMLDLPITKE